MNEIEFENLITNMEDTREKLNDIYPNISIENWSNIYNKKLANINNELRSAFNKYDKSVNPFITNVVTVRDFNSNVDILVKADFADVSFKIVNDAKDATVSYLRNPNSIFFNVTYKSQSLNKTSTSHYFKDNKEYFYVNDNGLETNYNLTDLTATQFNTVHKLDSKNIESVYSNLLYATNLAEKVTIENIDKAKALVLR